MLVAHAFILYLCCCSEAMPSARASNVPHSDKILFNSNLANLAKVSMTSLSLFTLLKTSVLSSPLGRDIVTEGPGSSESDVYYPNSWLGSWRTTRTITDITSSRDVPTPHFMEGLRVGDQFSYITSYIPYKDRVVRDRTMRSHLSEYSPMQSVIFWEPGNPSSLEIRFNDRNVVSIRTKRRSMKYGSDSTTTGEFVAYSEYFRIEDSDAVIADKPYAGRLCGRFNVEADRILGSERLYIYPKDSLEMINEGGSVSAMLIKSMTTLEKEMT